MIVKQKPQGVGDLAPMPLPDPSTMKWVALAVGALFFWSAFRPRR